MIRIKNVPKLLNADLFPRKEFMVQLQALSLTSYCKNLLYDITYSYLQLWKVALEFAGVSRTYWYGFMLICSLPCLILGMLFLRGKIVKVLVWSEGQGDEKRVMFYEMSWAVVCVCLGFLIIPNPKQQKEWINLCTCYLKGHKETKVN